MVTRREFIDGLAVSAATLAASSTAKSYARILGSNDRLNFAVIGLNSRGYAHFSSLQTKQELCAHLLRLRCGQRNPQKIRGCDAKRNG